MRISQDTREQIGRRNKYYGLYRGVVEYNIDPMKIGRCKVRVVAIHGTEVSIETKDLPWSVPMNSYGGFHDGGTFIVPPVGSTVWVQFEMGESRNPVYFGAWYKNPNDQREVFTKTSKVTKNKLPDRPISSGTWKQPIGSEVPDEILATPYDPSTHLIHKSTKGHTICIEDRDGYESLKITDRSGQEVILSSPVTDDKNLANAKQRGTRSVSNGDQLEYDDLAGGTSSVEILGSSGQGVRIVSKKDSEFISITSKDIGSKATPDAAENKVSVLIGGGTGIFEVSGVRNGIEEVKISVDMHSGSVEIKSSNSITLKTELINIISEFLRIKSNVAVDGDLSVSGDVLLSHGNKIG